MQKSQTILIVVIVAIVLLFKGRSSNVPMTSSGIPNQGGASTVYGPGTNPVVNVLTNTSFDNLLTNISHDIFN